MAMGKEEKFKGVYRIPSARAPFWNYGRAGLYHVTIVTRARIPFLAEILPLGDGKFRHSLSPLGLIVEEEWQNTATVREYMAVTLGAHMVMPDHFHGIVIIGNHEFNKSLPPNNLPGGQIHNLPDVIRAFKRQVTVRARAIDPSFGWQARYHDCIIRNERHFEATTHYILNNPQRWVEKKLWMKGAKDDPPPVSEE